jgi:formylglycine-generating enzyme required for sulfatase activity
MRSEAMRAALAAALLALAGAAEPVRAADGAAAARGAPEGMVWIPGGAFAMGDDRERPEERPVRRVTLHGFWIDRHEVTNAQFARFVAATGYVTVAERGLDPATHPHLPPELLRPGGFVFRAPEHVTGRNDAGQWWSFVPGASWRHPDGPGSDIIGRHDHPVVQVAWEDAAAYARWLGRDLPTEAQWEYAARGGLEGARYTWGETYRPDTGWLANSWQGAFPAGDTGADGHQGTAPVCSFPPNGFGLFDMAGNVWEHVRDWWVPHHDVRPAADPDGPPRALATRFADAATGPMRVIKGGSWLCAPDFCARYRPAARQPQEAGLGAPHVGFRTMWAGPAPGGGTSLSGSCK